VVENGQAQDGEGAFSKHAPDRPKDQIPKRDGLRKPARREPSTNLPAEAIRQPEGAKRIPEVSSSATGTGGFEMKSQQPPFTQADRIIFNSNLQKRFERLQKSKSLEGDSETLFEVSIPTPKGIK
jgi:hypothetical protein